MQYKHIIYTMGNYLSGGGERENTHDERKTLTTDVAESSSREKRGNKRLRHRRRKSKVDEVDSDPDMQSSSDEVSSDERSSDGGNAGSGSHDDYRLAVDEQPATSTARKSTINPKSAFQALDLEEVPYWKNTCRVDIDQTPYVWIYSSYYGNGWWFMEGDTNDHVEKLYQRHLAGDDITDDNHLYIHNGDFKYDYDKMCQVNRKTKTNRTIKRLDIGKLKEIEGKYATMVSDTESTHVWMFQAGSKYVPFMPSYQEELEAAYGDYQDHPENDDYTTYKFKYSNGYNYVVDFARMTQRNEDTGNTRTMSRVSKQELVDHPEYQVSEGFERSYDLPVVPPTNDEVKDLLGNQTTTITSANLDVAMSDEESGILNMEDQEEDSSEDEVESSSSLEDESEDEAEGDESDQEGHSRC
jgi:hypothetical protein